MTKSTLILDTLEARLSPVIAVEYLFLTSNTVVVSTKWYTPAPVSPFVGLKVDLGPAPIGALVGWPPIKVGR